MSTKRLLILAILLGGLVAYIKYFELPQSEQEAKKELVFKDLTKSDVEGFQIIRKEEKGTPTTITLKNGDKGREERESSSPHWLLEGVAANRVDTGRINSLLTSLISFKEEYQVPENDKNSDLSTYGLSDPTLKLKVTLTTGEKEIAFGSKNDYTSQRYFSVTGDSNIYLGAESLFDAADKKLIEFRERYPLKLNIADIKTLTIKGTKESVILSTGENNRWKISAPIEATGGTKEIGSIIRQLNSLKVEEFVDSPKAELSAYGLDKPYISILIEPKKETPDSVREVKIGVTTAGEKDNKITTTWFMLSNGPTVYKAAINPISELDKTSAEVRERNLFSYSAEDVQSADFDVEGSQIKLTKTPEGWSVNNKPGDAAFVLQLLRDMSELKASSFPIGSEDFGFDKPIMKAKLSLKSSQPSEKTLVVGKSRGGEYYAGVGDLHEPFLINAETFNKIKPKEESLLPAKGSQTPTPATVGSPGP